MHNHEDGNGSGGLPLVEDVEVRQPQEQGDQHGKSEEEPAGYRGDPRHDRLCDAGNDHPEFRPKGIGSPRTTMAERQILVMRALSHFTRKDGEKNSKLELFGHESRRWQAGGSTPRPGSRVPSMHQLLDHDPC